MSDKLECQKAVLADAKKIASLHRLGIPTGFLSKQSKSFLEALYSYLITNEIVYVIRADCVIGFIAVSTNTTGLYKQFLKNNILLLIKFIIQNLFSFEFMKKAFETLNAPQKVRIKELEKELPELLSIVVDDDYLGKGIGKKLLDCVEREMILLKQYRYKVLVGSNLKANKFYINNGFIVAKEVELHKGIKSFIYIKDIKTI